MNLPRWPIPEARWALRDLRRHPLLAGLLFITLTGLTALLTVLLLLNRTLDAACDQLMTDSASVTIRRTGAGGWQPMPAAEALAQVRQIPGVLNPRVRVWGLVLHNQDLVTVVGDVSGADPSMPEDLPHPGPGQAIVVQGLASLGSGEPLLLRGRTDLSLNVAGRATGRDSLAASSLVLLHIDDARRLLGLSAGQGIDLALDVFHDEESRAILQDLSDALPWPAYITIRSEGLGRCLNGVARINAPVMLAFGPALAALATLVVTMGVWGYRQRFYLGLLKAVGWGNGDIINLQLMRAALIGAPAVLGGLSAGYLLLLGPGRAWMTGLFPGWPGQAPVFWLPAASLPAPMMLAVLLIGLPYLTAVLWATWAAVKTDPAELLLEI
ncbi:MAG: hypothetical protein P8X55_04855 [Desulfosarcinaceae bacterium]